MLAGTLIFVLLLSVGFILYLLQAIGLYKIGRKLGIEYSWLSFIPVLNFYVLGAIVSQVNILGYTISQMGLVLPISVVIGAVMANVPVFGLLVNLAVFILYIYVLVYFFRKFNPESATVKTVVSIILPFMLPVFIFLMRNDRPLELSEQSEK